MHKKSTTTLDSRSSAGHTHSLHNEFASIRLKIYHNVLAIRNTATHKNAFPTSSKFAFHKANDKLRDEQKKECSRDRCECRVIMSRALALSYGGDTESLSFARGVKEKQMWQWQSNHLQCEQPLHNVSKKDRTEREHPIRRRTQLKSQVQD